MLKSAAGLSALVAGVSAPAAHAAANPRVSLWKGDARPLERRLKRLAADPAVRRYLRRTIRPLMRELAAGLEATPGAPTEPLPTHRMSRDEREALRSAVRAELPQLIARGPRRQPRPDDLTIEGFVEDALNTFEAMLASATFDARLAVQNQAADFNAGIIGNAFVAMDDIPRGLIVILPAILVDGGGGGGGAVARETNDIALLILVISLIIEIIGLVAALAGITLPKVNLGRIAGTLNRQLTSPSVRRAVAQLLRVLKDGQRSMTVKAEAIIVFLNVLRAEGLLSRLVSEMISDWDWEDYLRLGLGLLTVILGFVITAGAATAAKIAVALAQALLEIINKVDELIDRLE